MTRPMEVTDDPSSSVNADTNYDGIIQDDERDNVTQPASWGIQFHPSDPKLDNDERVRWSSAGCQVIRREQYDRFIEVLTTAQDVGQTRFSYLLIDSSNLPPTVHPHDDRLRGLIA